MIAYDLVAEEPEQVRAHGGSTENSTVNAPDLDVVAEILNQHGRLDSSSFLVGFGGIRRRVGYNTASGGIIFVRALGVGWATADVRVNVPAVSWIEMWGCDSTTTGSARRCSGSARRRAARGRCGSWPSNASRRATWLTIPIDGSVTSFLRPADPTTA